MFDAQLLEFAAEDSAKVLGPWMDRGGDSIIISGDLVESGLFAAGTETGVTLSIRVLHKNSDETGDGTPVGGTLSLSSGNRRDELLVAGLKEMVRYEYTANDSAEGSGWVLFRSLSPVWFDAV